jgi:hypothetical protein
MISDYALATDTFWQFEGGEKVPNKKSPSSRRREILQYQMIYCVKRLGMTLLNKIMLAVTVTATCLVFLLPTSVEAAVRVRGYFNRNGTYKVPHYRSNPNGSIFDNWSYPGNTNPYTGRTTPIPSRAPVLRPFNYFGW